MGEVVDIEEGEGEMGGDRTNHIATRGNRTLLTNLLIEVAFFMSPRKGHGIWLFLSRRPREWNDLIFKRIANSKSEICPLAEKKVIKWYHKK